MLAIFEVWAIWDSKRPNVVYECITNKLKVYKNKSFSALNS